MILKKIMPLLAFFLTFSFLSIPVFASYSYVDSDGNVVVVPSLDDFPPDFDGSYSYVDDDGNVVVVPSNKPDSNKISIPFTFLGNTYNFVFPLPAKSMQIVRDIVFYFLLAKSLFAKFKALPSIIGAVPSIAPSDAQQVAMYNNIYGK